MVIICVSTYACSICMYNKVIYALLIVINSLKVLIYHIMLYQATSDETLKVDIPKLGKMFLPVYNLSLVIFRILYLFPLNSFQAIFETGSRIRYHNIYPVFKSKR